MANECDCGAATSKAMPEHAVDCASLSPAAEARTPCQASPLELVVAYCHEHELLYAECQSRSLLERVERMTARVNELESILDEAWLVHPNHCRSMPRFLYGQEGPPTYDGEGEDKGKCNCWVSRAWRVIEGIKKSRAALKGGGSNG